MMKMPNSYIQGVKNSYATFTPKEQKWNITLDKAVFVLNHHDYEGFLLADNTKLPFLTADVPVLAIKINHDLQMYTVSDLINKANQLLPMLNLLPKQLNNLIELFLILSPINNHVDLSKSYLDNITDIVYKSCVKDPQTYIEA